MRINAYLIFGGNCREAFEFYNQTLGGELQVMTFGASPAAEHVPAQFHDRAMHACLTIGDQSLMASDTTPEHPYDGIRGCSVSLNVDSIKEAERVFAALSAGGKVQMPLEATFWAARFGMLEDRFGVPWMVNCEKDQ
ncbi:VOC family protein [Pseudomonas solani]|uniref:VOC family protein n=1 Tax=Pseudomonas solani TaxID=2731552 RepID=A0ABN6BNJ0_9PSED|nr:VOC family protein [Pseudomonas solani]EQM70208.1 hypothetical protein L682_09545 [Pseudomonas alcaligenes OT 69]MDN4144659.1 VOC family protein [Pseudomonas tohonis]BCD84010.1 VOC family protein [Pseudomonas solani]